MRKVMEIADEPVIVKSSRLKSDVWNDFDRVKKDDTFIAICRHCNRKLNGSSTSGTSHLRNHLLRCRRRTNYDTSQLLTRGKNKDKMFAAANCTFDQEQRKAEAFSIVRTKLEHGSMKDGINSRSLNFDNRQSRLDLARMIILHGYPMTTVEHVGFRMFVRNLQPLFDIATFDGVEADCREIYLKERQKVYEELDKLPGKIGLSADTWTANGDAEYLCLTAHYIDDFWQVKKKILNFLLVDPSQTDDDMLSEVIMTSLRNWDIDQKLFSVTFDNHSIYEKIVWKIREQLCQHRFLLCNGQLFDIPCAANLIKMMVQDTLEKSCEILHKVRESIRYVQCSQSTQEKFNEMVKLVGISSQKCLCLDNTHQWNSTYVMLDAALEYKDVFLILQEHDPHTGTSLSGVDWDRVSALTTFVKHFHEVSSIFRGNKCNTANIYFPEICNIHLQLIEWCQNSDDFIHSLALKMKSRFDEYWKKCSLPLAIAAILDPRFKLKLVEYYYPQIYGDESQKCIDTVSDCMKALYTGHAIYSPLASHGSCDGSLVGTDSRDRLKGFDRFLHETSESQSDLDKYLEEPLFPRTVDFNILNWWKVHAPRYPILSMMACNILGIPMSKVGPKLMYSTGNRAVDSYRSPLRSDTLQALMCAQDWMHNDFEDAKASSGSAIFALS